jgi:hypothetical protein
MTGCACADLLGSRQVRGARLARTKIGPGEFESCERDLPSEVSVKTPEERMH